MSAESLRIVDEASYTAGKEKCIKPSDIDFASEYVYRNILPRPTDSRYAADYKAQITNAAEEKRGYSVTVDFLTLGSELGVGGVSLEMEDSGIVVARKRRLLILGQLLELGYFLDRDAEWGIALAGLTAAVVKNKPA